MSLVGTRPPTVDEWEQYEPHHRARMAFRPGLTGLWQVSGRSNITDLNTLLIPRLASAGAAIGTLVAEGVVWIVLFVALRKEVTSAYKNVCYGKIILATAIGVVSSGWVKALEMGNFVTLLMSAVLFFGGYAIVLTVLKEPLVWEIENQVFTKIKGMM